MLERADGLVPAVEPAAAPREGKGHLGPDESAALPAVRQVQAERTGRLVRAARRRAEDWQQQLLAHTQGHRQYGRETTCLVEA